MKRKPAINQSLLLAICGFTALAAGTALNIVFGADFPGSIVPHTNIVTPCVNGFCTLLCLLFMFFPYQQRLLLLILSIQSIYDVLTGFEILGLFHFSLILMILFCKGFFMRKPLLKISVLLTVWFLLLLSLIPFGIERLIFAIVVTIFMLSAFIYIHYLLIDKLAYLLPSMAPKPDKINIDIRTLGHTLNLEQMGFTERQRKCIMAYRGKAPTYKELGEELCVSESTIKLEMRNICNVFGVKNREELTLLLSRYEIIP